MGYDMRHNPDPSTLRGRVWFVVAGHDARHGHPVRCMFEPTVEDVAGHGGDPVQAAVAICQRNGLCGDLIEVSPAELAEWSRWCDGFVPGNLLVPRPTSGRLLGTLSVAAPARPRELVLP